MTDEESKRLRGLKSDPRQDCETVRSILAAECLKCSACCVYYSQRNFGIAVQVRDATAMRLIQIGPRMRTSQVEWQTNRYMRNTPLSAKDFYGHKGFKKCISLEGSVGKDARCGIYETRPTACSDFVPGSPACIRSRDWCGAFIPEDLMALGHS